MSTPGNTTSRGYGTEHQRLRKAALADLAMRTTAGVTTTCPHCGRPMHVGMALDLDHTDDRRGYRGLAHRSCNRSAGGKKGNASRARRRTARPATSRAW